MLFPHEEKIGAERGEKEEQRKKVDEEGKLGGLVEGRRATTIEGGREDRCRLRVPRKSERC